MGPTAPTPRVSPSSTPDSLPPTPSATGPPASLPPPQPAMPPSPSTTAWSTPRYWPARAEFWIDSQPRPNANWHRADQLAWLQAAGSQAAADRFSQLQITE